MASEQQPISFVELVLPDELRAFQRRTADAPTSPNKIQFFGGHVDSGESFYDAAIRELKEETNLPVDDMEFTDMGVLSVPKGNNVFRKVGWVAAGIASIDFEDYEGVGVPEAFSIEQALARDDVVTTVRYILMTRLGASWL